MIFVHQRKFKIIEKRKWRLPFNYIKWAFLSTNEGVFLWKCRKTLRPVDFITSYEGELPPLFGLVREVVRYFVRNIFSCIMWSWSLAWLFSFPTKLIKNKNKILLFFLLIPLFWILDRKVSVHSKSLMA